MIVARFDSASHQEDIPEAHSTVFVYNGADYTGPGYRSRHVNTDLTHFALNSIQPEIAQSLRTNAEVSSVCLVYGLVKALSGDSLTTGRTASIGHAFSQAMRVLYREHFCDDATGSAIVTGEGESIRLDCRRYPAYMPVFNSTGALLPDVECIPGFGYVLRFRMPTREQS